MGYLVGSLAGALPLPAGLGAVDGGLIGALALYGAPAAPGSSSSTSVPRHLPLGTRGARRDRMHVQHGGTPAISRRSAGRPDRRSSPGETSRRRRARDSAHGLAASIKRTPRSSFDSALLRQIVVLCYGREVFGPEASLEGSGHLLRTIVDVPATCYSIKELHPMKKPALFALAPLSRSRSDSRLRWFRRIRQPIEDRREHSRRHHPDGRACFLQIREDPRRQPRPHAVRLRC